MSIKRIVTSKKNHQYTETAINLLPRIIIFDPIFIFVYSITIINNTQEEIRYRCECQQSTIYKRINKRRRRIAAFLFSRDRVVLIFTRSFRISAKLAIRLLLYYWLPSATTIGEEVLVQVSLERTIQLVLLLDRIFLLLFLSSAALTN